MAEPEQRMDADAFLAWAEAQPSGRYELVGGRVVAMAPERAAHARTKAALFVALRRAIADAGLPCEAWPDGMALRIDAATVYEPDAMVTCGPRLADDALEAVAPVVVAEVVSPSSRSRDSGAKLADYFRLSSVAHYLILRTETQAVIHYRRGPDGRIETTVVREGRLLLDPPGVALAVDELFDARR